MRFPASIPWIGFLALFGFLGCDRPSTGLEAPAGAEERAGKEMAGSCLAFRIAAPLPGFTTVADSATVTVSGPDFRPLEGSLAITDSSLEGGLCGIPPGSQRRFQVRVYDSARTLAYSGEGAADLDTAVSLKIAITLDRVGTVRIDGVVDEHID